MTKLEKMQKQIEKLAENIFADYISASTTSCYYADFIEEVLQDVWNSNLLTIDSNAFYIAKNMEIEIGASLEYCFEDALNDAQYREGVMIDGYIKTLALYFVAQHIANYLVDKYGDVKCDVCHGEGSVVEGVCSVCHGKPAVCPTCGAAEVCKKCKGKSGYNKPCDKCEESGLKYLFLEDY